MNATIRIKNIRYRTKTAVNPFAPLGEEDEEKQPKGGLPGWVLGAGGLGAASLGTAYGIGSDKQVNNAVAGFRRMNEPLRPNTTLLTQYSDSMAHAAGLNPFGMSAGNLMTKIRSQPWIMGKKPLAPAGDKDGGFLQGVAGFLGEGTTDPKTKKFKPNPITSFLRQGVGIPGYTTDTPELQAGAKAHYGSFAQGPIASVSHMMRGPRSGYKIEDPALTGGEPMTYKQYFGPRFEKYIRARTKNQLLPNEITTDYLPIEEQTKWLQDFHASLNPAEQAEKTRIETGKMSNLRSANTENYRPVVENMAKIREKMKMFGYTAGGAALGGAAGHYLHKLFGEEDEEGNGGWGRTAAQLGGAGLGGAAGFFGGTEQGRAMLQRLINGTKSASALGFGRAIALRV